MKVSNHSTIAHNIHTGDSNTLNIDAQKENSKANNHLDIISRKSKLLNFRIISEQTLGIQHGEIGKKNGQYLLVKFKT